MSTKYTKNQTQPAEDENHQNVALIEKPQGDPAELVIFLRDRAGIYFHLEDGHLARADELLDLIIEEQGLPPEAKEVFSLWFVSSILDIRLKAHHQPFQIVQQWDQLCSIYTDARNDEIRDSEPVLMVQRDVFYPKEQEVFITSEQMLCLLYHEAKFNVLQGRYALYPADYHRLAGLQALIHFGKFTPQTNVLDDYRTSMMQFFPECMYTKEHFLVFPRSKPHIQQCEQHFMDSHRRVSEEYADMDIDKSLSILYRKYLEVCWAYPFYASTFFQGQVETPSSRLKKLIFPNPDTEVWIAINTNSVTIIDRARSEVLLSIPFTQLSWEFRDPDFDGDNVPPPCLFLQFIDTEGTSDVDEGAKGGDGVASASITQLLKVYSCEAKLMDALIDTCVCLKLEHGQGTPGMDYVDSGVFDGQKRDVCNRLDKLCLSTFTKQGDHLEPK